MSTKPLAHFNPNRFDVTSFDHAKYLTVSDITFDNDQIILADDRWEEETKYLIHLLANNFDITSNSIFADYGCGTGRIAKPLISQFGCSVIGIDASESMKKVALDYVDSPKFGVGSLSDISKVNNYFDGIFSLWVLQHSNDPETDLIYIHQSLKPNKRLLIVNENRRYVPTMEFGWANDGLDIFEMASSIFENGVKNELDHLILGDHSLRTFWSLHRKLL